MPTSGTKAFSPKIVEIIEEAWEYLGLNPQDLEERASIAGRRSLQLVLTDFMNDFTPKWLQQEHTFQLKTGQASYDEDYTDTAGIPAIVDGLNNITSLVIRSENGQSSFHMIQELTADVWNDHPHRDRAQVGYPYAYWYHRGISPSLHFVHTPDSNYYVRYMAVLRPDTVVASIDELEVPPRFQSVLPLALALKLLPKLNGPQLEQALAKQQLLMALYQEAYHKAKDQEREGQDLMLESKCFDGMRGY